MRSIFLSITVFFLCLGSTLAQSYYAGFTSLALTDSSRIFKPNTASTDALHYRPVDLDIWYPSTEKKGEPLTFGDLFSLFEQRAVNYQDNADYSGITNELAQFYVAELGVGTDGQKLLSIQTESFSDIKPTTNKLPVIIYMAGFNGMGFENYKVLEALAQNGFLVVSIWSAGRYPGDMTNQKEDMLEQVYDAEFAIRYLRETNSFNANFENCGMLGCSWGGMSAAVFLERNPNTKAFVSLDGTETHYFGEEDENDRFIHEIYDSELLNPNTQDVTYLYLESGDKLEEFQPSEDFHYFRELNSEKYYLRFTNSAHVYFTCLPSILEASDHSVQVYDDIQNLAIAFFQESLNKQEGFQAIWERVRTTDYTTEELYDISDEAVTTFSLVGMVTDQENGEPLPYVNMGILSKEIGTVSDINGQFSLYLQEEYANDTLRISSIGYKPVEMLVKDISQGEQPISIKLERKVTELKEVVIAAKAFKRKTLGNKTKSKFLGTGFGYNQLGAEMGIKIKVRDSRTPVYVDAFNFNITHNRLSAKSVFRLNVYNISNNRPKDNILKENILIPIEPKQVGEISIDLKPYNIVLYDDAIVTLEWVESEGENNKGEAIFFSLGLFNSGTLYKETSQAKFKKYSNMGVGFNIDVKY